MSTQVHQKSKTVDRLGYVLTLLLAFLIPIEHKYDKLFRHFSLKLIPKGLAVPSSFDQKIYFYASDIIAITLFCVLVFSFRIPLRKLLLEKGSIFLWSMFIFTFFSLVISPYGSYFTVYTRLIQILTPMFLYLFVVNVQKTDQLIRWVFYVIVIAASFQAVIAISQYFSQKYLGLRFLSESRDPPAIFFIESARRWLIDNVTGSFAPSTILRRASGTMPHSNIAGGFFACSILYCYGLIGREVHLYKKTLLSFVLILLFFALNLTFSRSAIFATGLGTLIWFTWAFFRKELKKNLFLASCVTISCLLCSTLLFEQNLARGGIANYNSVAQNADAIRMIGQDNALKMIKTNPITGVGFQQFSVASIEHGSEVGTHNVFLFMLTERGVFCLISFLGFIGYVLFQASKLPFSPENASLLGVMIAFIFIGFCDFYPILSQQGKLMLFLNAALLASAGFQQRGFYAKTR